VAGQDPYWAARDLLGGAGVRFPRAIPASSITELERAADDVGFPCVLKALGVAHKSDVGGVALRLETFEHLAAAHAEMAERLAPAWFSVEEMVAASGVEMIIGARNDPRFGPVVMAGLGGVLAEAFADTAVELAAVTREQAEAMVSRLRGIELLRGFRGSKALDVAALADVIVAVSRVAAAHPEIAALDVNPVLVTEDGVIALDAHLVMR
jgi:acyl-CoA synthetase (NDP forming)